MSKCDTCKYSGDCKTEEAFRGLERIGAGSCSGFQYKNPQISAYKDIKAKFEQAIAYQQEKQNSWIVSENGCVITCPNCRERLELCYPDGTEVRYLPHCPWCGKQLNKSKDN